VCTDDIRHHDLEDEFTQDASEDAFEHELEKRLQQIAWEDVALPHRQQEDERRQQEWEDELILREQANAILERAEVVQVPDVSGVGANREMFGTLHAANDLLGQQDLDLSMELPTDFDKRMNLMHDDFMGLGATLSEVELGDTRAQDLPSTSGVKRYDPSRYGDQDFDEVSQGRQPLSERYMENASTTGMEPSTSCRGGSAGDDLSSMLDSLEMQSALLQGHLREAAHQIQERRFAYSQSPQCSEQGDQVMNISGRGAQASPSRNAF